MPGWQLSLFGRKRRQRGATGLERGGSQRDVVEERGHVRITGIDLVPDAFDAPRIEPTRDECCFSRSRRPNYEDRWS